MITTSILARTLSPPCLHSCRHLLHARSNRRGPLGLDDIATDRLILRLQEARDSRESSAGADELAEDVDAPARLPPKLRGGGVLVSSGDSSIG